MKGLFVYIPFLVVRSQRTKSVSVLIKAKVWRIGISNVGKIKRNSISHIETQVTHVNIQQVRNKMKTLYWFNKRIQAKSDN